MRKAGTKKIRCEETGMEVAPGSGLVMSNCEFVAKPGVGAVLVMDSRRNHTGNKYLRSIRSVLDSKSCVVDVYCVLEAYDVRCSAIQHAVKKLLCAGIRGKASAVQDLEEARDSILRAIEMAKQRNAVADQEV